MLNESLIGGWFVVIPNKTLQVDQKRLKGIVIKPDPGIDPVKEPGLGFHRSTRVKPDQPGLILKKLNISYFI